jgi:hypothetical protein
LVVRTQQPFFYRTKNNLCLFLIWKLQKVYDENPDCGLGFPDLVKNQISRSAFFFAGRTRFFFVNSINKSLYLKGFWLLKTKKAHKTIPNRIAFGVLPHEPFGFTLSGATTRTD